ncbi:MAG: c-type cytochrome [Pyrinomonadaceae bacterium]
MFKSTRLVGLAAVFVLAFLSLTLQPQGEAAHLPQNTNSSTTKPEGPPPSEKRDIAPPQQDFSKNTWDLPANADKTKNPVEANEESIAKGKDLFMTRTKGNCIFCHGETGAGNKENLPRLRRVPADLSDAKRMPKLSDGEIFWKITRGIPGIMPSREKQLTEEERWHVVNFVRTLTQEKPSM